MNSDNLDKYLYIEKTPTWLVRSVYILGMFTWVGVIYGYSRFLVIDPVFLIVITPVVSFLILYHLVSYCINMFYKQFDLDAHRLLLQKHDRLNALGPRRPVDVFLPICGESNEVIARTFAAVARLNYSNKKVYVLDDKGLADHRALADKHSFTYLSRENKGFMKKAGNLKHGFERSTGEFIVIFDADFAPHPDFIKELLPYMDDPKAAIIQSPQYFQTDKAMHKRSSLEYGAAHIQEDFYRIIQVARDRLGAPICCGSNAIYRRKALDEIGGTFQIEHSEDMHTGFELSNKGWKVRFVPIILAAGFCPDGLHSFFHQQHRWCSGSLSLMLDKKFWKSNLSFSQKTCFISGFMYYLSHPVTTLLSFQVFFLLFFYSSSVNLWNALPFIPCILFSFAVIPLFRITRQRYGGFLARTACVYSYNHAVVTAFIKKSVGWQPTNIKSANVSKAYMQQIIFAAIYFLVYIAFVGFAVHKGVFQIFNINYFSLLFWVFYNLVATSMILFQLYLVLDDMKQKQIHEDALSGPSLSVWRLKTAGVYSVAIVAVFFGLAYFPLAKQSYATTAPEVTSLKVVLQSKSTPTSLPRFTFTENHEFGDYGQDVFYLQQFLNKSGFVVQETGAGSLGNETYYFGVHTYQALVDFQLQNNIAPTGYLGSTTREMINTVQD